VDRKKPTRLLTDILTFKDFGHPGWPKFDARGFYLGPLPRVCGHNHRQAMIGRGKDGGFNTSPTAAYPEGMCAFIAEHIMRDFLKRLGRKASSVGGDSAQVQVGHRGTTTGITTSSTATSWRTQGPSSSSIPAVRSSPATATPWSAPGASTSGWTATSTTSASSGVGDLGQSVSNVSEEEVSRISELIEQDGALRPIKDGLLNDGADLINDDDVGIEKITEKDAETSEEERELPGQKRPRKGAGWWGRGRPLQPHRKGMANNFVDGAGTPSPGRWRIEDRRLPENEVAEDLRAALRQGLETMEPDLPGGTLRKALFLLAAGGLTACPF
jgi:hypothetical protein